MNKILQRYRRVPQRLRLTAVAATCIVCLLLHYLFIYTGQKKALAELEDQFRQKESDQAQKAAYAANLPKYKARFDELTMSLNSARAMLPDSADVPQLLARIGNAARDTGLVVETFAPKDEKVEEFFAEIGFAMRVQGAYHDIATFIDQLSRFDRIVNVTDLHMISPKVENQKVILSSNFFIKTFRFLTEAQAASADKDGKKGKNKP